jgi:uncharacterized membrane protein
MYAESSRTFSASTRGPVLFGDPARSALAHAPFVPLAMAPLFDVTGLVTGAPAFWALSFWSLLIGLAFAVPATLMGLWDCAALPAEHQDAATASHHTTLLLGAVGEFLGSLLVRGGPLPPPWAGFAVATSVVGLVLLVLAAFHGGALLSDQRARPRWPAPPPRTALA